MSLRRKLFSFAIDPELSDGMRELERRDGISKSEQARRALRAFLKSKGVTVANDGETKTARKRVRARKRA